MQHRGGSISCMASKRCGAAMAYAIRSTSQCPHNTTANASHNTESVCARRVITRHCAHEHSAKSRTSGISRKAPYVDARGSSKSSASGHALTGATQQADQPVVMTTASDWLGTVPTAGPVAQPARRTTVVPSWRMVLDKSSA